VPHIESWVPHNLAVARDGPKPKLLISSGSKKKEPRYACLSEARASHSHKKWAEVSSPTPHFLHRGLSSSPSRWRCLLTVLWPVRRPVTALDWVLLKVINFVLVPRLGPEINSWACLWVSPSPRHWAPCWLTSQRPSLDREIVIFVLVHLTTLSVFQTVLRRWQEYRKWWLVMEFVCRIITKTSRQLLGRAK